MAPTSRQLFVAGQLIGKRLDALDKLQSGCGGLSLWFMRVFFVTGGLWAMAAAQIMSFADMLDAVSREFSMGSNQQAMVSIGAVMLGAFVGAFFFGHVADIYGRKHSLLVAFTVAHVAGTLSAVSPSASVLLVFRFLAGLGIGGQQPVACALLMELAPANVRGRALVYLDAFSAVGYTFAMVFCRDIEPSVGWRAVCGCNALALLYLPVLYYSVPESPKWLATAGRLDDALRVLREIEQASSIFNDETADFAIRNVVVAKLVGPAAGHTAGVIVTSAAVSANHTAMEMTRSSFFQVVRDRALLLLRFPYLSRTFMLWFVWTALAAANSAMCVYLDESFVDQVTSESEKRLLLYGVLVAQLLGNLSACSLIDRIGRRPTIVSFVLVAACGALLEVYLPRTTLLMLLSSCLRNFAFYGAWGCLFAYTPELYPNAIRVIGIGYAWGISRLGFFAAPHAVFWLMDHLGATSVDVTWILAALAVIAAASILAFGIETKDHDAERARFSTASLITDRRSVSPTSATSYQQHDDDDDDELAMLGADRPLQLI